MIALAVAIGLAGVGTVAYPGSIEANDNDQPTVALEVTRAEPNGAGETSFTVDNINPGDVDTAFIELCATGELGGHLNLADGSIGNDPVGPGGEELGNVLFVTVTIREGPGAGGTLLQTLAEDVTLNDFIASVAAGDYSAIDQPMASQACLTLQFDWSWPVEPDTDSNPWQATAARVKLVFTLSGVPAAGIQLTKQASPTSATQAGDIITYTYTVTNTGDLALEDVTVTENAGAFTGTGPLPVPAFVSSTQGSDEGELKQGERATYTAEYTVTEDDIAAGSIFNRATATGYFEGTPYSDDDTAVVTTNSPNNNNNPSCPTPGCVRLLTVDWDGTISTTCLDPYDRCSEDLDAPSPDGKHSLLLETWTRAPEVDGTRHYLITIREIEDIPPLPENLVAVAAFKMDPSGALFDRNVFLTLGLDGLPDDAVDATIAYYDDVNGVWVPLDSQPGEPNGVAELTLTAAVDHFTIFALLVDVDPDATRFVVSDLGISTDVEKLWSPLVFLTRVGRNVEISASVANEGRWSGAHTVVLKLDGEEIDSERVTLGAGQSHEVTFRLSDLDYGHYEVQVSGLSGEFTARRTIAWWLIVLIAAVIGFIIRAAAHDRKRRRAHKAA